MTALESELVTFDIHLATDRLGEPLKSELVSRGFRLDRFADGTEGVIHKFHLSLHPHSRPELESIWNQTTELLRGLSADEFYGYGEAEVVGAKYRAEIELKPFDASVPPPFGRVSNVECPPGRKKSFDFHVSADIKTLDPGLEAVLEGQLGFYHVDIEKSDRTVRVFTFQPMDVAESPRPYFDALYKYLCAAGGMQGKLKMEATFGLERFPKFAHVPPVVVQMPAILAPYR